MGVDIPDIRYIIYIGIPQTLLDYAQESRHAEQDRQPSKAIIIQPHRPVKRDEPVQKYMDVVPGVGCRRYILDRYLDRPVNGYKRRYCRDEDPEEMRCNEYNPEWQSLSSSAYSAHSAYSGHSEYADRDSPSDKSIVFQALLISIAEQQRQRVQAQQQAAPDIQQRMQDADQWLDEKLIEQDVFQ